VTSGVRPVTATRLAWATFIALLALSACATHRARPIPPTTTEPPPPTTTSTPIPVVGLAPLTGLPVTDPHVLDRPAVIVKIDDAPQARPQVGVDKADVVIEERVEGGIDRLMAVFQSMRGH
jgi:hypothetical protein